MRKTRPLNRYFILFGILICHYAGLTNFADSVSVSKITATFQKIQKENRLVGEFRESDMASLPVGILKEINGKAYVIAINQARFTPKGDFFNVYAQLAFPGFNETMSFAAVTVAFTNKDTVPNTVQSNIYRITLTQPMVPDYETSSILSANYEHKLATAYSLVGKLGIGASFIVVPLSFSTGCIYPSTNTIPILHLWISGTEIKFDVLEFINICYLTLPGTNFPLHYFPYMVSGYIPV